MEQTQRAKYRRWANVVVILTGLFAAGFAIWGIPIGDAAIENRWWWASGVGGFLALAAPFVAMRAPALARILLVIGAVALLLGLLAFEQITPAALITTVVPALLLLAATPFFGKMPTPEDEGMSRSA